MLKLPIQYSRRICWTDKDCELAYNRLMTATLIANDIETLPFQKKRKGQPFTMTVNAYSGLMPNYTVESYCFPFQNAKDWRSGAPANIEAAYFACHEINDSGIPFTGHNYVYDLMWLMRYHLPVKNWAYDSMVMFWSKWPELPKRLDFVSSILLDHYQYWKAGRKSQNFHEYCNYAMSDTESTLLNTMVMVEMCINDPQMRRNFAEAMLRCMAGLDMSARGGKVNFDTMAKFGVELKAESDKALGRLQYLVADPEFNPNSPKQKSHLIYTLMGAKKRNAKGKFVSKDSDASTGAFALRAMRADHPLFRRVSNGIMEAMEPAKQLSNVVGLEMLNGRFLTSYDGVGTTTTRFGSRTSAFGFGGNGQNIRKKYRTFVEADEDSFLLEIDYSAADDVFVSFESGEQKKIDLVRSGKDIHASNAAGVFFTNWTYDEIVAGKKSKDPRVVHPITGVRQITKKLVHGCHYLMAGATLLMSAGREAIVAAAKELGHADAGLWSQQKLVAFCEFLEGKFRIYYPRFARQGEHSWYSDLRRECVETSGFTTIFGYYQRFLGEAYEDAVLRAIAATAGQANTAGRVNMAMNELKFGVRIRQFRDGPAPDAHEEALTVSHRSHGVDMRFQTHDSFTFNVNCKHKKWQEGVERIFHVMNRPVLCKGEVFQVGIEADVGYEWASDNGRVINNVEDIEKFLREVPRKAA